MRPASNTTILLVDHSGDVLCWHGIPAVKRTSKTARHPDRVFWACAIFRGEEGHCEFFKWDDDLPPHNHAVDPDRQWHPPAQASQTAQGAAGAPFSGPSSPLAPPAPVSPSPFQPSSQTQPSSQPPAPSLGYPTPSTPARNKRPLPDTCSPSPSRIPKRAMPYAPPGIPYDLVPPPPSTYAAAPHSATDSERGGSEHTHRSHASGADEAAVERLVSAMTAEHSARVRAARSVQTDPTSDIDAPMESEGVAQGDISEKGKEREKTDEWEFFNPGPSSVGAGPSSVTSTATSSESIADMINGLGGIPAYVGKLERQVAALQKGSDAKARRIKELLDENERLKKDKARMRAALRLAVADLDDDSATLGDEPGPSGSASQH